MGLKKCGDCGAAVSKRATACPNCGAPAPAGPKRFGCLSTFLIIGAICLALMFLFSDPKPKPGPQQAEPAAAAESPAESEPTTSEERSPAASDETASADRSAPAGSTPEESTADDSVSEEVLAARKHLRSVISLHERVTRQQSSSASDSEEWKNFARSFRSSHKSIAARVDTLPDDELKNKLAELLKSLQNIVTGISSNRSFARSQQAFNRQLAVLRSELDVKESRPARASSKTTPVDEFIATMEARNMGSAVMHSVAREGETLTITMANGWHLSGYEARLRSAKALWVTWARIVSPGDLDSARIRLVDFSGTEVGGSRVLAGSLIWVQKK